MYYYDPNPVAFITDTIYSGTILFIAFLAHVFISRYLAESTVRWVGWKVDPWFYFYLFLPGITHVLVLAYCIIFTKRSERFRKLRDLVHLAERAFYLNDWYEHRAGPRNYTVTPFEGTLDNVLGLTDYNTDIMRELRDEKIDELIEWKLWSKAFMRARHQLREARKAGDKKSVELYRAYIYILRPYVDITAAGLKGESPDELLNQAV